MFMGKLKSSLFLKGLGGNARKPNQFNIAARNLIETVAEPSYEARYLHDPYSENTESLIVSTRSC